MKRGLAPALSLIPLTLLLAALLFGCGSDARSASGAPEADSGGEATAQTRLSRSVQASKPAGNEAPTQAVTARPAPVQAREAPSKPSKTPATLSARTGSGKAESARRQPPEPFTESPRLSGGSGNKADSILDVRHGEHAGFERIVVDLGVGRRPAQQVPEWTLASPTGDGLLRLTLPSITSTRPTDGSFGGSLASNYYVVRSPEAGMFIDIFSRSAFIYRVMEVSDPARLVVDFKPSPANLRYSLPAEGGNTVLTEPRAGSSVEGPLVLSGYSRNPEAMNTIVMKDSSGKVLLRDAVSSNDWTATWGYFETTLAPPPFSGAAKLQVGAESPRDGSFTGTSIRVRGN